MNTRSLNELATDLDLSSDDLIPYGSEIAKVKLSAVHRPGINGKLVLMTAMSPSLSGEGKTTTAIGLVDALRRLGTRACVALREPSMGPVFGRKGGGSGGGMARVVPSQAIDLHFTGDLHAITQAHNLLSAALDNSLHFGNPLSMDARDIGWPRVHDLNERSLREVVVGLGGRLGGVTRQDHFSITAASEVMAILSLSRDWAELRQRLGKIVVASSPDGRLTTADDLKAAGAMAAILRDALQPNLVQTLEGSPALVHCGPFANIAHGTNSLVGSMAALRGSEIVVQEAGFGVDLGAEKFIDMVAPQLGHYPALAVVVVTLQAMKYHGGLPQAEIHSENPEAVERGLANAISQLGRMQRFGIPVVACLNRRATDSDSEVALALQGLRAAGFSAFEADVFGKGGAGALELAEFVRQYREPAKPTPAYQAEHNLEEKIRRVACDVYGASGVEYSAKATKQMRNLEHAGFGSSYVCIAKTQYSLSDDPKLVGAPQGFSINVSEVQLRAGAGFVVPIAGEMSTMPALSARPNLESVELHPDGTITGL
jgi:formate--tetrahydrofolate ligase